LLLDPLSVHYSEWLARFLLYDGDLDACIAQCERTMEMDEICHRAQHYLASALLAKKDAEGALGWYRRAQSLERAPRAWDALIVRALAALGMRDEGEAILARLDDESQRQYFRGEIIAMGYAAIGNADRAFSWLERAYQDRSAGLLYLKLDPGLAPLRGDPRFTDLVQRVGVT
jgi:tetratricopeptide (TPR) repeat protein